MLDGLQAPKRRRLHGAHVRRLGSARSVAIVQHANTTIAPEQQLGLRCPSGSSKFPAPLPRPPVASGEHGQHICTAEWPARDSARCCSPPPLTRRHRLRSITAAALQPGHRKPAPCRPASTDSGLPTSKHVSSSRSRSGCRRAAAGSRPARSMPGGAGGAGAQAARGAAGPPPAGAVPHPAGGRCEACSERRQRLVEGGLVAGVQGGPWWVVLWDAR